MTDLTDIIKQEYRLPADKRVNISCSQCVFDIKMQKRCLLSTLSFHSLSRGMTLKLLLVFS